MATVAVTSVPAPGGAASVASEEEVAKKKNTDCVYFLASPLTCKKGDDCEFRHSESARLNPRDCWYWLGGNCLNRECPFRHPPLEGRVTAQAAQPPPQHTKKPVPCYYFSQGCCMKGPKCQFLHGQEQQENPVSSSMVYRLADATSSKQKTDSPEDNTNRRENERRRGTRSGSISSSEAGTGKPHRDNSAYTWKLSEHTPQKESAVKASSSRQAVRKETRSGSVDKVSQQGGEVVESKAAPEFDQAKGKRKLLEEENQGEQDLQHTSKRRLSNGSVASARKQEHEEVEETNNNNNINVDTASSPQQEDGDASFDEDDEDFARKLRGMFSSSS